jgi:hypothetical protein
MCKKQTIKIAMNKLARYILMRKNNGNNTDNHSTNKIVPKVALKC